MKVWCLILTIVWGAVILTGCGRPPLLENVSFAPDVLTPNADGVTDVAKVEFTLNRSAMVSITIYDQNGQAYIFRSHTPAGDETYTVYFPGVVDGYVGSGETYEYQILKRTLPDGIYTWEILAVTNEGESAKATGTLTIENSDTVLPGIRGFDVSPDKFSPNQDGIDDRVQINLFLEKDVESSQVYLEGTDGVAHPIPEDEKLVEINKRGFHSYDWDGGIDAGNEPPEDGVYTLYAYTRDRVGQQVILSNTLEIVNAGMPRAYILNGEVKYSATTMVLSETLCYTLTVENDSKTHIRTTGPWSGATYRSDQNFNTLGWSEESGVFRVGMDFDTSLRNYPFRWGIGTPGVDLVQIDNYWYLPPETRSVVTGCVQVVEMPVRNPLYYWMGLIHEDVEIAQVNNRVDPNFVTIWEP
ncbi:MAG: gliding motility-associated C-terminal domain-containing protein [Anaerolineae bacterium]|nr:gliding motility-associated C-terminal domain-containing protein [Anaerolineae bacterium]